MLRQVASVLVLVLAAGCTAPQEPTTPLESSAAVALPPLLPPLLVDATMPVSMDDSPVASVQEVDLPRCEAPTETCHRYPFSLPRNATVTAYLEWRAGPNDLDLYAIQGDLEVASSHWTMLGGPKEFFRAPFEGGDYEMVVVGHTSLASDAPSEGTPYSLQVFFDEPAAARPPNP